MVYPTLTMLEEEGFATVSSTEGSKKLYAATDSGLEYLKENKVVLKAIFGRMEQAGKALGGVDRADHAGDHESPLALKIRTSGETLHRTDTQSRGGDRWCGTGYR